MAERRMFAKTIIDSDAFLEMPASTQMLYFHLTMRADDEGFLNNPKRVMKMVGASEDDMKVLIAKRFILVFESGVIVIKHWKIHNYIRGDRIKPTVYADERSLLTVKDNGAYTMSDICQSNVSQLTDNCQHRLGKDSLGKDRLGECKHAHGKYENVMLTDDEYEKLKSHYLDAEAKIDYFSERLKIKGYKYDDHYATIVSWADKDERERQSKKGMMTHGYDYDKLLGGIG